jgi:hypothetical protein
MVPLDSDRVSRAPPYSRTIERAQNVLSTRLSRALVRLSSRLRLYDGFLTRLLRLRIRLIAVRPHTTQRRKAYT